MVHGKFIRVVLFFLTALVWALPAGAYWENEVDIKGTVFAVDNDQSGNVIAVSILDPTGEEYFVVHDEVGDKLLKLVDKNLKVTGVINVENDGKKKITIKKFEFFSS